jgi:dephospho-CoA kinase
MSSGKSTVAGFIKKTRPDALVLDVDTIARGLYEKYPAIKHRLRDTFGDNIFKEDGHVDFGRLAGIVFSSRKQLIRLNRIMFPWIRKEVGKIAGSVSVSGHIIIDAAVLFGAKLDILCHHIILVEADEKTRKKFLKHKKISHNDIELKVKGQHIEINQNRVDFTIINDGNLETLLSKTLKIIEEIEGREKRDAEGKV